MTKRFSILTILLVVLTSFAVLFAQSRNTKDVRMQLPDPNHSAPTVENPHTPNIPTDGGDQMVWTGYDYETNNATRRMIDLVDLDGDGTPDPIMVAMKRDVENSTRHVVFAYKAFGIVDTVNAFDDPLSPVGWGIIQYCVGGPMDGEALVMAHVGGEAHHSWIDLVNLTPILPFPTTTFGGNFPSFVYLQDGTIVANTTDYNFYISDDGGQTFSVAFATGDGDPNFDLAAATDGPAELPIRKSNDDMTIASVGVFAGAGTSGNPDVVYWYGSTDGGASWFGQILGVGSGTNPEYGQVANRDYAPYFENFSQVGFTVDPTGVTHVMINGYGEGLFMGGTDTVNVFPMLYYNTNHQQWLAVTMEEMEAPDDGNGNNILDLYPGNGIGNAYGTVATSGNGQVVFVLWQGPEYTGEVGNSAFNVYPGDGGPTSTPHYYTNIYYSASEDGGATWGPVGAVEDGASVMEEFPVLASDLEVDGNQATAHYIYYIDPIPGVHLFSENSFDPNGVWMYNSYTWTLATSVDDEVVVDKFELEQNYPNPFNPSTTIKYSLAEQSDVSLKVYDILGNEVATLVNATQQAGSYEVNFDASDLASGLYLYTIKAGNFTSTKKMMLLK